MSDTITFHSWEQFVPVSPSVYGTVLLNLRTGTGKTLRYPVRVVERYGGNAVVVVPQRIHVFNNFNFHLREKTEVPVQGLCRQFNRWTSKNNGPSYVSYTTAGSFLRRLITRKIRLEDITYLILDEVHVTDTDYCTLLQVLNQFALETAADRMPQIVLSSATLNEDVQHRLRHLLNVVSARPMVTIVNEATPYQIDVRYQSVKTIEGTLEFMTEKTKEAVDAWYNRPSSLTQVYPFEGRKIQPGILHHLPGKNECHELGQMISGALSDHLEKHIQISYIYSGSEDVVAMYKETDKVFHIIIATNADSGVTLPIGITVDSGLKKKPEVYINNEGNEVWSLKSMVESRSGMIQRRGRVGRTGDGIAYHCLSEKEFEQAPEYTEPGTYVGENNEYVLALLDAGMYLDPELYSDIGGTLQRLIDLELLTPNAHEVLGRKSICSPHEYTTTVGQQCSQLPLPVLWSKMIVLAPANFQSALLVTATFFALLKQGHFFRGKTSPTDFSRRQKLMGASQLDFIQNLWDRGTQMDQLKTYKEKREYMTQVAIDSKSVIQWRKDYLELSQRLNLQEPIFSSDIAKYISVFLTFDGILLGQCEAALTTVYSDGHNDLAFRYGGASLTNYLPSSKMLVTDQIMHFQMNNQQQVYTCQLYFPIDEETLSTLLAEDAPYGEEAWINLSSGKFNATVDRMQSLLAKLINRRISRELEEAMLEAHELLERELFDTSPPPHTIGDKNATVSMSVNQRRKLISKYLRMANPFSGGVCPICQDDECTDQQFVLTKCEHLYHSRCYDTYLKSQEGKSEIRCALCRAEGKMVNFVILAVFIHKGRKKESSPVAPRKGRVQYVTDDGLGHLPEHIRREIAQTSTSPSPHLHHQLIIPSFREFAKSADARRN